MILRAVRYRAPAFQQPEFAKGIKVLMEAL
jgi:hypothetical protein